MLSFSELYFRKRSRRFNILCANATCGLHCGRARAQAATREHAPGNTPRQIHLWRERARGRAGTREHAHGKAPRQYSYGGGARVRTGGHARARAWQSAAAAPLWRKRARGRAGTREHAPGNAPRQCPYCEGAREHGRARASTLLATLRGNASMARARARTGELVRARCWQHSAATLLWRKRVRERAGAREHAPGNAPRQCLYDDGVFEDGRDRASTFMATLHGVAPMARARAGTGGRARARSW